MAREATCLDTLVSTSPEVVLFSMILTPLPSLTNRRTTAPTCGATAAESS